MLEMITSLYQLITHYAVQHKMFSTRTSFKSGFFGLGSVYDNDPNRV